MNYSNRLDRYPVFEQIRKVADQLQLETYVVGDLYVICSYKGPQETSILCV